MSDRSVVILSGVRTAIGSYGGSLKDLAPTQLAAMTIREALGRSGVEPARVGHVVYGNVIHTEPKDMYISRVAAIDAASPSRRRPHRQPAVRPRPAGDHCRAAQVDRARRLPRSRSAGGAES